MKKLLLISGILLCNFSAHARTLAASSSSGLAIELIFGRPTADVYLCGFSVSHPSPDSVLDRVTFPDDSVITAGGTNHITFDRLTTPASSILFFGSTTYGASVKLDFCHDLKVPAENPGGSVVTLYKIVAPNSWSYFTNADVKAVVSAQCSEYDIDAIVGPYNLSSNSSSDYIPAAGVPFVAGESVTTNPSTCMTSITISEENLGVSRIPGETAGQITLGVKDEINYN